MKPELLSPAGSFEKLRAAVTYGADAVYLAGRAFGMRAAADNFSIEELYEAVAYAHAHGVRVYLTVNTMPRENEYPAIRDYLMSVASAGVDAMIVADIGVMSLVRELLPDMQIHVSTQASSVSSRDCMVWRSLGAKRVVLARELSFDEIRAIRANIPDDLELECFIHGSMCISYSGRCLLSNHLVGRDGNRGMCAQPCRWSYAIRGYEIVEEKRPDIPLPVEEVNGETFIMSSRDTCMIEHIPELVESGINSLKIEGRMKSSYYTAVVTNTYRMALDSYFSGEYQYNPAWRRELESVSHRDYGTGYYFSDSHKDANTATQTGYLRDRAFLATVTDYDPESGYAKLSQRNKMCIGDVVELLTPGKTGEKIICDKLFDADMNPIQSTPHPYMTFYMKMPHSVNVGDILRGGE